MWLETTIGGAGRLTGDLTGPAAAAVAAVLDALGARGGPEDTRTLPQRQHDALAEACQRLIDSGMLPGRDSQPPQLTVHVDLAELRGQPGACGLEAGWSTARAAAAQIPGSAYLTGPEAAAAACDAALTPVVSGHIDGAVLDQLTDVFLDAAGHRKGPYSGAGGALPELTAQTRERLQHSLLPGASTCCPGPPGSPPTCAATCCPPGSPACPSRWTSAAPPGSYPPICAKPSSSGTKNAASPAVSSPPRSARSTI